MYSPASRTLDRRIFPKVHCMRFWLNIMVQNASSSGRILDSSLSTFPGMIALTTSFPSGSSKGWNSFCMDRRNPSSATRRASLRLTSRRLPVRIWRLSSVAIAKTTWEIISFSFFWGILTCDPPDSGLISGYSAAFMTARLLRFFMQRMVAVRLSVTEMLTVPAGILRISSVNSRPGSTVWPSSWMAAAFVYSMTSEPSEQVSCTRPSSAEINTPSRICLAGRADNARVTVFSPSRRSCAFMLKIIRFNLFPCLRWR